MPLSFDIFQYVSSFFSFDGSLAYLASLCVVDAMLSNAHLHLHVQLLHCLWVGVERLLGGLGLTSLSPGCFFPWCLLLLTFLVFDFCYFDIL